MKSILLKIKYIYRIIVGTPYFKWIIFLQVISGFANIAGIPLLIPILEYMQNGETHAIDGKFAIFYRVFEKLNIVPSFQLLLIAAFSLIVLGQGLVSLSVIVAQYAQLKISGQYRKRLIRSYLEAEWLTMTEEKSGEMSNAILRETDLAGVAHLDAQRIIIYTIQVMVLLFLLFKLSITVTIISLLLFGALFTLNINNSYRVQKLSEAYNERFKKLASTLTGLQQNKKFIKASNLPKTFVENVNVFIKEIIKFTHYANIREQTQLNWSMIIPLFFLFSLIFFHKQLSLTLPELFVLLVIFQRLSPQFITLFSAYTALHKNIPIHDSIFDRLNSLEKNIEISGKQEYDFIDPIKFCDVGFYYPGGDDILTNINIEINPRQTIALVGGSGAGKSTLLDLILGLIKPNLGKIMYGGIRHDDLDQYAFRKNIAYVSQETTLFDGSLRQNLAIGFPDTTESVLIEMCKQIHIYDFVKTLPQGLDTQVGENGIKLSGGQKQRIALGRSLLMRPKLLVLDEATSDLDSETEMYIQEAINKIGQQMTVIIVAHRLNTVKSADIIYVIENGKLYESGSYSDLIEKKGRLYQLNSI